MLSYTFLSFVEARDGSFELCHFFDDCIAGDFLFFLFLLDFLAFWKNINLLIFRRF